MCFSLFLISPSLSLYHQVTITLERVDLTAALDYLRTPSLHPKPTSTSSSSSSSSSSFSTEMLLVPVPMREFSPFPSSTAKRYWQRRDTDEDNCLQSIYQPPSYSPGVNTQGVYRPPEETPSDLMAMAISWLPPRVVPSHFLCVTPCGTRALFTAEPRDAEAYYEQARASKTRPAGGTYDENGNPLFVPSLTTPPSSSSFLSSSSSSSSKEPVIPSAAELWLVCRERKQCIGPIEMPSTLQGYITAANYYNSQTTIPEPRPMPNVKGYFIPAAARRVFASSSSPSSSSS